ncbi:MAG: Crp/Fnr family transcriptional regulator [Magnetovibrionaceae bacterium]
MNDMTQDRLAGVDLLRDLSPEERQDIEKAAVFRSFSAKQTVFDKDDSNRDVMFVLAGEVNITSYSITGKEISYDQISAGDFFGELAAIDGEPRSATVVTTQKTQIACLSPDLFRSLLEQHTQLGWKVFARLAGVIRNSNERIMDFATLSSQQRVTSELLRLAKPDAATPGAWSIYPLPTQSAIASRIGTSRETVARVIGDLIRGDLMVKKGRAVFIPDREKLETLVRRLPQDDI